jgi:hypothetical protein
MKLITTMVAMISLVSLVCDHWHILPEGSNIHGKLITIKLMVLFGTMQVRSTLYLSLSFLLFYLCLCACVFVVFFLLFLYSFNHSTPPSNKANLKIKKSLLLRVCIGCSFKIIHYTYTYFIYFF